MILPGNCIGVLGGGQLGMFFTAAAQKMGYKVAVWDPNPQAPARSTANYFIGAPFNDPKALLSFIGETRGVTFEWENIPADLVAEIEEKVTTRPSSNVLRLFQNRATQKKFLHDHGFPVAPFYCFHDPETLHSHLLKLGLPCIVKTAQSGYDGQGQWHIDDLNPVPEIVGQLQNNPSLAGFVVEKKIDLQKELSVVVVRGDSGEIVPYPVVENIHEEGILRISRVPAKINEVESGRATELAVTSVLAIKESGVFCVEMFLDQNGALLINEIAPRPHNSGHYSMDVSSVSQFEQQIRVLCELPIIAPKLISPATLVNILGSEITQLTQSHEILSIPDIRFYDYHKTGIKPGRKMGHLLIINKDADKAMEQAQEIVSILERDAL